MHTFCAPNKHQVQTGCTNIKFVFDFYFVFVVSLTSIILSEFRRRGTVTTIPDHELIPSVFVSTRHKISSSRCKYTIVRRLQNKFNSTITQIVSSLCFFLLLRFHREITRIVLLTRVRDYRLLLLLSQNKDMLYISYTIKERFCAFYIRIFL